MQGEETGVNTRRVKPTSATDVQTMTVIDKWLAARACTFEDGFEAIIKGIFHSWAELMERVDFSHLRNSNYCDLNARERKAERTRLLTHATNNWEQGATIRSPMQILTFYKNGLKAKWVSLIPHRSESLAGYQNLHELIENMRSMSEGTVRNQMRTIDPGRSKGGRDRHRGT